MPTTIEERVTALETQMTNTREDVRMVFLKMDEVATTLASRPSWTVVFVLTFLSSLCVGLAVTLASVQA